MKVTIHKYISWLTWTKNQINRISMSMKNSTYLFQIILVSITTPSKDTCVKYSFEFLPIFNNLYIIVLILCRDREQNLNWDQKQLKTLKSAHTETKTETEMFWKSKPKRLVKPKFGSPSYHWGRKIEWSPIKASQEVETDFFF